jgi:2,3-bisphosphoglycerate-independent phosphoglycerate mutase
MSAPAIADAVVAHMEAAEVALILVNFANADMVGHTGNLDATIKAVECLDRCLARISQAAAENGYTLLITADHGNAEQMLSADGTTPLTSHTTNQVPLLVTDVGCSLRGGGGLRDVAPTLLAGMGIPSPESMTGTSLLGPA